MTKASESTFLGHPKGLFVLFFTEMWERFSYYGMRVLLVLYMTKHLIDAVHNGTYVFGFGALESFLTMLYGPLDVQPLASNIYGWYIGLVYFTPFFGGIIADRFIGQRKSVFIGGIIMAIGHFIMAFDSMFLLALLCIIIGNGFFKPNISTQVGSLYPEGDPRRDSAFTIFYMGINLGALFSPIVCGTLGQFYGWHYGFTAAGVGMLAGLLIYIWGQKYLGEDTFTKAHATAKSSGPLTKDEWVATLGLTVICTITIVFWAVFEQQGNTLQVFAEDNTDWSLGSLTIPSTWLQVLNPLFIFMFAPIMLWIWNKQGKKQLSSVAKMSVGCLLLGLCFLPLIYVTQDFGDGWMMSFLWFIPCMLVLTIGELFLSPIGLSLISKVAPAKITSMMMGVWFGSSFFGGILSGYIGGFYSTMSKPAYFTLLMILGIVAAIAIFVLQKPLKKAVGNDV